MIALVCWVALSLATVALVFAILALFLLMNREEDALVESISPEVRAGAEGGWVPQVLEGKQFKMTHDAQLLLSVKDANQKRRWMIWVLATSRTQFFEQDVKDITR